MSIPLPQQLTGSSQEQLQGMKTYLYQLAQELQFALGNVEQQVLTLRDTAARAEREVGRVSESQTPKAQFSSLKALIIKSADIVNAYYEEINRRLSGEYVAISDFGTYRQETQQVITENSQGITRVFSDVQTISTSLGQTQTELSDFQQETQQGLQSNAEAISQVNTSVQTFGTSLGQAQDDITTIGASVTQAQSDIQGISTSVTQAQSDIQDMDASLSRVQDDITTIGASVSQAQTDIQGINTSLGQTQADIQDVSDSLGQARSEIQAVDASLAEAQNLMDQLWEAIIQVNAWIKTGKLGEDENSVPIYGVEIGQQTIADGLVVFQKFARLMADRLSFFDRNGNEVSFIGDEAMHITRAEIQTLIAASAALEKIQMGDYTLFAGGDGHLTLS